MPLIPVSGEFAKYLRGTVADVAAVMALLPDGNEPIDAATRAAMRRDGLNDLLQAEGHRHRVSAEDAGIVRPREAHVDNLRKALRPFEELAQRIRKKLDEIDSQPTDESGSGGHDIHDIKDDIAKKIGKKRKMNAHSAACASEFRKRRDDDKHGEMKEIVGNYAEKHKGERGAKASSIIRILNDNPDQWKQET
jgi:hypothetical protein